MNTLYYGDHLIFLRRYIAVLFVTVTLFSVSSSQTKQKLTLSNESKRPFRIFSKKNLVRMPFELYGNNVLVQVRINHSRPFWFIFDTGAGVNVIDQNAVARLRLKTSGRSDLNGGGGTVVGSVVENATIGLSGVEVFDQTIAAAPLDALSGYFDREITGIIGNDLIKNFVIEIDYGKHVLIFHDPKTYNIARAPGAIKLENHGGTPYVEAELLFGGGNSVTSLFEIDTGSNGILSINGPFAEKNGLLQRLPKASIAEGVGGAGIGGDTKNVDARISSIRLGAYTLNDPIISISQDTKGFGAGAEAGFIGTDLLRRFTVTLDYPSQRILLRPNAQFRESFKVDLSGLELITEVKNFSVVKIKHVRANFPAANAGLLDGDKIVSVDGRSAAELGLNKLTAMFKNQGKKYSLVLKRGSKTIHVILRLKRTI